MERKWLIAFCVGMMIAASGVWAAGSAKKGQATPDRTISFAKGRWDAGEWTPLRLPSHEKTATFVQKPDCIGTNTFTMVTEDVTPAPYNQPPLPASGTTCTVANDVVANAP